MTNANLVSIIIFPIIALVLCAMIVLFSRMYQRMVLQAQVEQDVASQESEEERRRKRKESISNGLNVKEWVPVDSTEGDQDTPPLGETVEAPQPPAPPINLSPVACAMRSDDCGPVAGEEERAGCAICLSHFRPQQLVCESNNSSCQHVFHKDCMVDWLMKDNENCPMCREVYLLKTDS